MSMKIFGKWLIGDDEIASIVKYINAQAEEAEELFTAKIRERDEKIARLRAEIDELRKTNVVLRATIKMLRDDIARMKRHQEHLERKPRRKERIGGAK